MGRRPPKGGQEERLYALRRGELRRGKRLYALPGGAGSEGAFIRCRDRAFSTPDAEIGNDQEPCQPTGTAHLSRRYDAVAGPALIRASRRSTRGPWRQFWQKARQKTPSPLGAAVYGFLVQRRAAPPGLCRQDTMPLDVLITGVEKAGPVRTAKDSSARQRISGLPLLGAEESRQLPICRYQRSD